MRRPERKTVAADRVRYGDEREGWAVCGIPNPHDTGRPCDECGVLPGQFHGLSCDAEVCARCGGQALVCDVAGCQVDDDEEAA